MSVKPQYETYRYTDGLVTLRSQSMVECRLAGSEIGSILAVQATAIPTECVCVDGEVRYKGKAVLCIVYEDGDGKVCRVERGIEFFHKAEGREVTPACFSKTAFTVVNVTHRREGSGLYVTAIIDAVSDVYGSRQIEFLVGGENLVTRSGSFTVCKTVCVSGETEGEDEFETDYVGDIVLHGETVIVTRAVASGGQIDVEGEITLGVCALKSDDGVCSYERIVPFRMQIPSEEAFGSVTAGARVFVKSATLSSKIDEDKGTCKVLFHYELTADCLLSTKESFSVCQDAFSPSAQVDLERQKDRGRYLTNQTKCVERVDGKAVLSPAVDGDYTLVASMLPHAEMQCKRKEKGFEVEGILTAQALFKGENGYRTATLTLPFVFPLDADGEEIETDCMVSALNIRRKKDGDTEVEATIKVSVRSYDYAEWEYIASATEGEIVEESDAGISVFVLRENEDLWQVAKRLSRMPEELQKSNPELKFPVKAGERIFVYRQIKGKM